jgi:hypothetical protein
MSDNNNNNNNNQQQQQEQQQEQEAAFPSFVVCCWLLVVGWFVMAATCPVRVFVNGHCHTIADADPDQSLLDFIRSLCMFVRASTLIHSESPHPADSRCMLDGQALTGTKSGCDAGICGACTVMLSHFDTTSNTVVYVCHMIFDALFTH